MLKTDNQAKTSRLIVMTENKLRSNKKESMLLHEALLAQSPTFRLFC